MGMNWDIDYDPRNDEAERTVTEIVVVASADEIPLCTNESKSRLYLLPRLDKSKYMRRNLPSPTMEFLNILLNKFGEGKLISYKNIRACFQRMDQRSVSQRLHILWVNGFSDKYVMGQFNRGFTAAKRKTGIVGRWWGVHYSFYKERQI